MIGACGYPAAGGHSVTGAGGDPGSHWMVFCWVGMCA